jgi:hypothetical protein
MKPQIHLVVALPDGRRSDVEIAGDQVTHDMRAVADILLLVLQGKLMGEDIHAALCARMFDTRSSSDLYGACARAFDTTRADAKERLLRALYGSPLLAKEPEPNEPEPTLLGWTWRAHLADLHAEIRAKHWVRASKRLVLMLGHVTNKIQDGSAP